MSISGYTISKFYLLWLIKWQAGISTIKSNTYRLVKPRRTFGESLQQPEIIPHITRTDPESIGYSPLKSQ